MASSGYEYSYGYQGRCLLFEWWTNSVNAETNVRNIHWKVTAVGGSSSSYYHHNNTVDINGSRVYTGGSSDYVATNTVLAEDNMDINQNNTTTLTVAMHGGIYYVYTDNIDTEASWTLDEIPRYATITSMSVASRTIDSLTFRFTADRDCSIYLAMVSPQSTNWLNNGQPFITNSSSGTFTVNYADRANTTRLSPNTNYVFTVLSRATISELDKLSDTSGTTLDIARLSNVPNINVGQTQTITWTNPSNADTSLQLHAVNRIIYKCDGLESGTYYFTYNNINYQFTMPTVLENEILVFDTQNLKLMLNGKEITTTTGTSGTELTFTSLIQDIGTVTDRSLTLTPNAYTLYSLAPNSTTGTAAYILTTTRNNNSYTSLKSFTFTVTNSNPIFSDYDYEDTNTTTTALTGNNKILIKGYSSNKIIISTSNKAIAQNSTTMATYKVVQGNKSATANYSDNQTVEITPLTNIDSNVMTVYATDSRGNSTAIAKTLSSTNFKEYTEVILLGGSAKRSNNGVGKTVTLKFNGKLWNNSFGSVTNSIVSATYKYKETSSSTWIDGTTTITVTQSNENYSFEGTIKGDLGAEGFDVSKSFNIQIIVNDELSQATFELTFSSGTPAISITPDNKVAIGQKYDTSLGGALQVKGDIYQNGQLFEIPNINNNYSTSTDDGYSCDYINKIGEVVEIVRGQSAGSFAQMSCSENLSHFRQIIVQCTQGTNRYRVLASTTLSYEDFVRHNNSSNFTVVASYAGEPNNYTADVYYVSDTKIAIKNASSYDSVKVIAVR